MFPWGHFAIGYLVYVLYLAIRRRRLATNTEVLAVLLGTQLPDLIDKPLAWTFDVLPTGRSLGHSLLTAFVLIGLVAILLRKRDELELLAPFAIGYVVGILTDLPTSVLRGDFSRSTFVLWPLLPSPNYDTEPSFAAHFLAIEPTPLFVAQIVLFVLVAILIVKSRIDGVPSLQIR